MGKIQNFYFTTNKPINNITITGDCVCLFHQLLCLWETVESEENMSKWKALRIEPSSSWQSPMHAPQWGLCAWPLHRQWNPGQERETRPSNLQCNTLCTKLLCFFVLTETQLGLHPLLDMIGSLQVHPGSRCVGECFSNHVTAIHSTTSVRGLSISERLLSSWGSERRQTTGAFGHV